jgi:hypothetical protein
MIVGGLMAVAPVFGPLEKTLHYLADFIAERPQPMRGPDISFFRRVAGSDHLSHRAALVCHIAGIIYPKRHANPAARMIATSASHRPMKPNPATWVMPAAKSRSLLQVAVWLISLTHDLPSGFALEGYPIHLADSHAARFSLGA